MSMLQEFLIHKFINIAEDESLAKLKKACLEVIGKLNKKKSKIISYTLVAFDPHVSASNADIIEVNEIIARHWRTFVSNANDTPITYIRAVMLEALESLAKNLEIACLIWLVIRNPIKHYKLDWEKDLLGKFLLDLGDRVEKEANNKWSLNSLGVDIAFDALEIKIEEIPEVLIDKETLRKKLEDASGPQNKNGEMNYESPNPHWSNQPMNWSYEFAPRATNAIAMVVNKALSQQGKIISSNQTQLQNVVDKLIETFKSVISKTQQEILEKNLLLHMRTQLLWWKESSLSKTLRMSYKGIDTGLLQLILALDYAAMVPHLFPLSTDYFLLETVNNLSNENDQNKIELSELFLSLEKHRNKLEEIFSNYLEEQSRVSLLNFIKGFILQKYELDQFQLLVGIDLNTKITLNEFSLWVFHDAQAQKIVLGS